MTEKPQPHYLKIDESAQAQRLDNFLFKKFKNVPKSLWYRLIRKGAVKVNDKKTDQKYKLQLGDTIRVPALQDMLKPVVKLTPKQQTLTQLEKSILYDDQDIIVINKPAGIAVHGGSGLAYGVIEAIRVIYNKDDIALVHRLDRDTSGCLLLAKRHSMLRKLHEMMRENTIRKHYQTLVKGLWPTTIKHIDAPLRKFQLQSGERMVVVDKTEGKPAMTLVSNYQHFSNSTLLQLELKTGRTHQIRVHCQACGHAIAGDEKYGDANFNQTLKAVGLKRLFLHAKTLSFAHPRSGETLTITAALPAELAHVITKLNDPKIDQ